MKTKMINQSKKNQSAQNKQKAAKTENIPQLFENKCVNLILNLLNSISYCDMVSSRKSGQRMEALILVYSGEFHSKV